ncbi:hypothetical protein O6H91_13G072000 [Diphasiastrum complanatum]|uniref:Uncharacterized protein n=1 Tax=Diphasiastrum complanatum TaxID=34168 RepID=A0ACC2BVX2_DIPCM|nr:hypothetical protein O6H91_13G072000 [Diphasiastrum complanatum]
MGSDADNETTALSDFEEDGEFEVAPVGLSVSGCTDNGSEQNLKAALAELDSEKQARKAAETGKAELEASFARLKLLSQQAVRQRDEAFRQRDEALRGKDDGARQLADATVAQDNALKQRDAILLEKDEIMRQKEAALKARDIVKTEIETAARLLVTAADNITAMASGVKGFPAGLPRTGKYTGVAAVAYGFSKRAEEVVDEVLRQQESAVKGQNEMRDQIEQRNIQIAIEVSELEASISQLKEESQKRGNDCNHWQKIAAEKDTEILQIQRDMAEKANAVMKDADGFKTEMVDAESKVKMLELELQKQNEMLVKQFQMLFNAYENLVHLSQAMHSEGNLRDAFSVPSLKEHETKKMHEACLTASRSVSDLAAALTISWKESEELRWKERKELEGKMERSALKEKEVTALLRSVLENKEENLHHTRRQRSKKAADSDVVIEDRTSADRQKDEAITLASALDIEVNYLRQEVLGLEKSLAETRLAADKLKFLSNSQAKGLSEKAALIEHLENKEGILTQNIEVLSTQISAVQEEVARWKHAATEEANAGVAVLEEVQNCNEEIASLNGELVELRKSLEVANYKLQSKEDMAAAAVTARNAAEQSLRIADERAADLRERLENLTQQLDEAEGRIDQSYVCDMGFLNLCCSWLRRRGRYNANLEETGGYQSAEMEELMEPLV